MSSRIRTFAGSFDNRSRAEIIDNPAVYELTAPQVRRNVTAFKAPSGEVVCDNTSFAQRLSHATNEQATSAQVFGSLTTLLVTLRLFLVAPIAVVLHSGGVITPILRAIGIWLPEEGSH